jgi:hypothetical protein
MAEMKTMPQRNGGAGRRARRGVSSGSGHSKSSQPGNGRDRSGKSGNPKASYERYTALAQSSAAAGDVVEMENYYQHAEHYFRLMKGTES